MTPRNLLNMLEKYKPEWHGPLMNYVEGADLKSEYSKMPPGPIEDVTQQVHKDGGSLVVELPFAWYDIGTFDAIHEYLKLKNIYNPGSNVDLDGKDNFIRLDDKDKIVALVGVDNLIIIDTKDALLVCSKSKAQNVKEVVERLIKKKKIKYL